MSWIDKQVDAAHAKLETDVAAALVVHLCDDVAKRVLRYLGPKHNIRQMIRLYGWTVSVPKHSMG